MKSIIKKLLSTALTLIFVLSAFSCVPMAASAESSYINDGETIEFFKTVTLNLKNQKANEKPGKLFIGWQKQDNTWPKASASYKSGDVLTAKYIDFKDTDFAITGYSVKDLSGYKLRMAYNVTAAMNTIPNVSEKGMIWVKTDEAGGREIRVDEPIVTTWVWDLSNKDNFSPDRLGVTPKKSANTNVASISINSNLYNTFYTARGYIKYTTKNGVADVLYTEEQTTSAYKVSKETKSPNTIHKSIISAVEKANKAYVDAITEQTQTIYSKDNVDMSGYKRNTESYDAFAYISTGNGGIAYKRTVWLGNTGIKETVNLGWLSDVHFNYVNQTDVDKQVTNALSSYRGRSWLRDGTAINNAISQINYVSKRYKKTVITGDMVDYLSYGSLFTTKALIADKSINGSILMTTGNHEFAEWCQNDAPVEGKMTLLEKYEKLSAAWSNDPTYYAEILKTSKGADNAMIILLDNGQSSGKYADGTAEKLQASIDIAKEKNIPVFIFQHVAMSTYNNTEKKVYYAGGMDLRFGVESDKNYYDMTAYNTKGGEVFKIIRQNSDVVKGIFCGHEHAQMYTEVTALDENGDIIPDKFIPQFITSASAYGWVNEIVVEAPCNHKYDTPCDYECNICHKIDITRDHKYDGDCDNKCNLCGETRMAYDHTFDGPKDTKCNECGAARVFGGRFIKEGGDYCYYFDDIRSFETGLVKVNGKWFYVKYGVWDTSFTELYKKNGKWLYVEKGRWSTKTDLVKYKNKYFLVIAGKWSSTKNTLYKKSGKFFAIKNGKWYKYKTIITYSGKKFYCDKGFAQLGFSGRVKIGSKTYTVKKGQVK